MNSVVNLARLFLCGLFAVLIGGFLAEHHFFFDLVSHLRLQLIAGFVFASILLGVAKSWRWMAVALGPASVLGLLLVPYFFGGSSSQGSVRNSTVRLLVMNVLTKNRQTEAVASYIKQQDPDVFALLETNHQWVDAIKKELGEDWKYQTILPRGDNFGILMFSKLPFEESEIVYFGEGGDRPDAADRLVPSISAWFKLDQKRVRIIATHPLPPIGSAMFKARNVAMMSLAREVKESGESERTIVCGDLNCTPWSSWFGKLLQESNLRDSALGFGLAVTWAPFKTSLLGLPIDHVLIGEQIEVMKRQVGPNLGSDHRPIVVEFQLREYSGLGWN